MDLMEQVTTWAMQHFPNIPWLTILTMWLALSRLCVFIQSKVLPPKPGSIWVHPYQAMVIIGGTVGYAMAAYGIGRKALYIAPDDDRTAAALKLGYDPATVKPKSKAIPAPAPTKAPDEADTPPAVKAAFGVISGQTITGTVSGIGAVPKGDLAADIKAGGNPIAKTGSGEPSA